MLGVEAEQPLHSPQLLPLVFPAAAAVARSHLEHCLHQVLGARMMSAPPETAAAAAHRGSAGCCCTRAVVGIADTGTERLSLADCCGTG